MYTALREFYFTADEGTIVALLGHNGAGKTTLINVLTGTITSTKGNTFL
jgi:ABC-type multidrug transport system ATPase subunit